MTGSAEPAISGTMGFATALLTELRARGWTVAIAESLTGGMLTSALVEIPGSSASLRGGVIAYDTALKREVLGVDAELLAERGPVDGEVAAQMAEGVRRALAVDGEPADVGMATTGIAGPGSPDGQPVGTVWLAIAMPDGVRTERHVFDGDRAAIRAQSVRRALDFAVGALGPGVSTA